MSVTISGSATISGNISMDPGFPISATAGPTTSINVPVGTSLSFSPFSSVTGGNSTYYIYSIISGTLPAGLTLNSQVGVVSGTVTTTQTLSPVTFAVSDAFGQRASTTATISFAVGAVLIQYLAVGGGGGGGGAGYLQHGSNGAAGGGGGGGGLIQSAFCALKGTSLSISIGPGGVGASYSPGTPTPGSGTGGTPSTISSPATPTFTTIIAYGGGKGGCSFLGSPSGGVPSSCSKVAGGSSGSGGGGGPGGAAAIFPAVGGNGGTATPSSQGFPGGHAGCSNTYPYNLEGGGGGGGGAGSAGTRGTSTPASNPGPGGAGGAGGAGTTWPFTGPSIYYAGGGGGGGGGGFSTSPGGAAGIGGGGIGQTSAYPGASVFTPAMNGTPGTGGGGGGGGGPFGSATWPNAGAGGPGIVSLAVLTSCYPGSAPGATVSTPPAAPGYTVITYTSPGTYTV